MESPATVAGRTILGTLLTLLVLTAKGGAAQDEWRDAYKVGDRVELNISGSLWQKCVVTENAPNSVMKGACDELVEPAPGTYRRAGGVYILSRSDTRKAVRESRPSTLAAGTPATVDRDNPAAVRHATGKIGKLPPTPPPARQVPGPAGLRVGEYACYGSGGRIMAGLGFQVLSGSRYADLEGGNAGSFSIAGTTVTFRGGHLDGQAGRDLRGHSFTLAAQAECEPF